MTRCCGVVCGSLHPYMHVHVVAVSPQTRIFRGTRHARRAASSNRRTRQCQMCSLASLLNAYKKGEQFTRLKGGNKIISGGGLLKGRGRARACARRSRVVWLVKKKRRNVQIISSREHKQKRGQGGRRARASASLIVGARALRSKHAAAAARWRRWGGVHILSQGNLSQQQSRREARSGKRGFKGKGGP